MTFIFRDGDEVVLKNGEGHGSFLPMGSFGTVFCQYRTVPPAYEVNFRDTSGEPFGAIIYEDEIEAVRGQATLPARETVRVA